MHKSFLDVFCNPVPRGVGLGIIQHGKRWYYRKLLTKTLKIVQQMKIANHLKQPKPAGSQVSPYARTVALAPANTVVVAVSLSQPDSAKPSGLLFQPSSENSVCKTRLSCPFWNECAASKAGLLSRALMQWCSSALHSWCICLFTGFTHTIFFNEWRIKCRGWLKSTRLIVKLLWKTKQSPSSNLCPTCRKEKKKKRQNRVQYFRVESLHFLLLWRWSTRACLVQS